MTAKIFKFVRHDDALDYLKLGWIDHPNSLKGTHHGEHATLMEWTGDGEPPEPCQGPPD